MYVNCKHLLNVYRSPIPRLSTTWHYYLKKILRHSLHDFLQDTDFRSIEVIMRRIIRQIFENNLLCSLKQILVFWTTSDLEIWQIFILAEFPTNRKTNPENPNIFEDAPIHPAKCTIWHFCLLFVLWDQYS